MKVTNGNLEIAVVIPLEDPRGDVVDHLRTWTRSQTLPRERFQIVIGADGRHPEFERRIAGELGSQDEVVSVPDASLMRLYDAAARAASAPVLLLTEAHVRADPGCLAAVTEGFARDPKLDGATLTHLQSSSSGISQLSKRWFARHLGAWDRAGWARLNTTGLAVSGEAYEGGGGLDSRLGLYAPSLWSARLDQKGARIKHLDDAVITHELEDEMGFSLELGGDFARGECIVRREQSPEFCERYFGPAGLFGRRYAYRGEVARAVVAALCTAIRESPRDAPWLARELAARLPASLAGARTRRRWERTATLINQAIAAAPMLPDGVRWRSYVAAHEGNVRSVQLEELALDDGLPEAPGPATRLRAGSLDGVVIGSHGLEANDGQGFRWTEPVTLVRFARDSASVRLRLDTGGIRGDPGDCLQGVYVDGGRLPAKSVRVRGNTIEIDVAPGPQGGDEAGVVLITRSFAPPGDGRRLGLPLVELELSRV